MPKAQQEVMLSRQGKPDAGEEWGGGTTTRKKQPMGANPIKIGFVRQTTNLFRHSFLPSAILFNMDRIIPELLETRFTWLKCQA